MSPAISRAILAREGGEEFLRALATGKFKADPYVVGAFLTHAQTLPTEDQQGQ
jgi:hypothetical protein